jgi:hypothetical protein
MQEVSRTSWCVTVRPFNDYLEDTPDYTVSQLSAL